MYIHLGEDTVVKQENIVGIFDLEGQAVQNMNLMFGLKETEGLELVPMFP